MRIYRGSDRAPLDYTPDDFSFCTDEEAVTFFDAMGEEDAELIFLRIVGSDHPIPKGFSMLGYDAGWGIGYGASDGFSAICDQEGTEFLTEFMALNHNGLFDRVEDASEYLIHYLSQEWSEMGDFYIYEVYGRD